MNVRPSSLGLDAFGGSCSSPPAAWTPRPACDGRRRIRAWQGFRRPPRWPAPEPVPHGAEACDEPACARCGRGPWPTFYESPVVGCRRQDPSPRRHVAGAARRLRASSGAGSNRVASLLDRRVNGLVGDRGAGTAARSGDSWGCQAARSTAGFMMVSYSMGVNRPKRACPRRRW